MTTKTLLFAFCAGVTLLSSCKKSEGDLTSGIVGHYTSTVDETDIVVNKVDDNTISITLQTGLGSGKYDVAFPTAKMNSENSFTLNPISQDGSYCTGTETFSGTGSYSNNNISIFMTVVGTTTSPLYGCEGTETRSASASK